MFRTIMSRPVTRLPVFPRFVSEYSYDEVSKKRMEVGKRDIVAFVDAPRDDCQIYSKITRFCAGDISALGGGEIKGVYTDISGMPTDYNTIMASVRRANDALHRTHSKDAKEYLAKAFQEVKAMQQKFDDSQLEPPAVKESVKENNNNA